jgi:hypothetical protein
MRATGMMDYTIIPVVFWEPGSRIGYWGLKYQAPTSVEPPRQIARKEMKLTHWNRFQFTTGTNLTKRDNRIRVIREIRGLNPSV